MQMNHDEYIELKNQLQQEFDGVYVKVDNCKKTVDIETNKISELKEEFSLLREEVRVNRAKTNTRLDILIAILSSFAVPIIGVCVKIFFG